MTSRALLTSRTNTRRCRHPAEYAFSVVPLVALLAANIYVFCFGLSWGSVTWVLLGELFNNRIQASALALGVGAQWIANFLVSTTFPPIAFNLGLAAAYGLYTGFAVLSFLFVAKFIKETKGRELEDME